MESLIIKVKYYKKELEEIETELQKSPAGRLGKQGLYYYHVTNEQRVGITKNTKLIRQLCRKRYLIARKKQLSNNLSLTSHHIDQFDVATPEELIRSLPATYQGVPVEYFFHPSIEEFLTKNYRQNTLKPEEKRYFTKNGIALRSKSEFIIATFLEEYNIPYRYEIAFKSSNVYPDFTIKNPFDGKTFLWEHFGMVHKDEYEQSMNKKMSLYMNQGYIPFETIIYTYEADIEAKDNQRVRYLIENIILQA